MKQVESVLEGRNYIQSLKGMLIMNEAMQGLHVLWKEFFQTHEKQLYSEKLKTPKECRCRQRQD